MPFSTTIGSMLVSSSSFTVDNFIDILKSFPTGEEKEKLVSAFTKYGFATRVLIVDGANLLETLSSAIPSLTTMLLLITARRVWKQRWWPCGNVLGDYALSNEFYLISENTQEHAAMVLEWASQGYASEIDLFVTRAVLWFIQKKNLRDANAFFAHVKHMKENDPSFSKLPLIHYCGFILETVTVCCVIDCIWEKNK